jgi:hypothetical protein
VHKGYASHLAKKNYATGGRYWGLLDKLFGLRKVNRLLKSSGIGMNPRFLKVL